MSLIKIVCANCGAQYRLPETFKGASAKCKKCGATIDVAGQRQEASSPGTRPAAAAPQSPSASAPAPSAPARSVRREARAARGSRPRTAAASRRGRRGEQSEGEEDRRGGGSKALVWGSIGALAVIAVVLVLVLRGSGDAPANTDTAQLANDPAKQAAANAPAAAQPTPPAADASAAQRDADAGKQPAAQPADAVAEEKKEEPAPKSAPKSKEIKTKADVFDPTTLQPVEWPAYVSADDRAVIGQMLDDIENGGIAGIRAKSALEKMGHKALAGIINKLREVDYTDSDDSQRAYELNALLGRITLGKNAGFKPVEAGEEIPLEIADHNARTAKTWQGLLTQYPTPDAFAKYLAERKAKGEDK